MTLHKALKTIGTCYAAIMVVCYVANAYFERKEALNRLAKVRRKNKALYESLDYALQHLHPYDRRVIMNKLRLVHEFEKIIGDYQPKS